MHPIYASRWIVGETSCDTLDEAVAYLASTIRAGADAEYTATEILDAWVAAGGRLAVEEDVRGRRTVVAVEREAVLAALDGRS